MADARTVFAYAQKADYNYAAVALTTAAPFGQ